MYIMNQAATEIYNSEFFDHVLIVCKSDAKLIVGSRGRDMPVYTLGRYRDMSEAREVLGNLYNALKTGEVAFDMPLSEKVAPETEIKDARTKRRGKS